MQKIRLLLILSVVGLGLAFSGCAAKHDIGLGMEVAKTAHKYIGLPYVYGGRSPKGFDCSGLVWYVYKQHGIELPSSSAAQAKFGKKMSRGDMIPGDLVFFQTKGRIHHVGLYVGGGKMIHAPGKGKRVVKADLDEKYYQRHFASVRRVY